MEAFIVTTLGLAPDPSLAVAAARSGALGILDLGVGLDVEDRKSGLRRLARHAAGPRGRWGVRWETFTNPGTALHELADLKDDPAEPWPVLLLGTDRCDEGSLRELYAGGAELARSVFLEVHSVGDALRAQDAGFDGLILKGSEAGGLVGSDSTFILLQRVRGQLEIPYWAQGGIGPDTAGAALVAGATGVVLREQLWLTTESPLPEDVRGFLSRLDGSETVRLSGEDREYRVFSAPGSRARVQELARAETVPGGSWADRLGDLLTARGTDAADLVLPAGQEIAFASSLADRHGSVARTLQGFRRRIEKMLDTVADGAVLAPESPMASAHGTRYPILQGPMTRVSDVPEFAEAVADDGALPFLALALMRRNEVADLLDRTSALMGSRPWGVGILGFVPQELRQEQLEEVVRVGPSWAIIAGGRPSQSRRLEEAGIATYLHAPSPGLLETFIDDGARRFIFEGRECGGHVGPRSSFTLWQSAVEVLEDADVDDPSELHVVFAGGIHDATSAAMAAAIAAPLVERGVRVGVLMGTGYLFTEEAVTTGAIQEEFQRQAVECRRTRLLESGYGHATRCADSPFADEFEETRRRLMEEGRAASEVRNELELLNVGRLRLASKGVTRKSKPTSAAAAGKRDQETRKSELVPVEVEEQRREGLYMIGDASMMRDGPTTMANLHEEVALGSGRVLRAAASRTLPWQSRVEVGGRGVSPGRDEIAIIGLSGIFPKAEDVKTFWGNIFDGVNAIEEVPPDRWDTDLYFSEDRGAPDRTYSRWGGFVDPITFNPVEWGMPPASLESIEPVHLYALEVAARCFRDAGYEGREGGDHRERTGCVFAVAGPHDLLLRYVIRTMMPDILSRTGVEPEFREVFTDFLRERLPEWTEDSFAGFLPNVLAGRIANRFNLGGPNYVVDAACAASLAAVQSGMDMLRLGRTDMMMVGAADIGNNPFGYTSFAKTRALSPGGHCRPYDDRADGIGLGESVSAMLLKRKSDAERDGDRIYAVIKGVGASSDGGARSLTAPAAPGQMMALRRAYEDAELSPATVSLVEAHGTGTAVGDRTEAEALTLLFKEGAADARGTALGSVKSMIGHTKVAAGMSGLIKTALALKHRVLPPTFGVETPNRDIDFQDGPLYLNTETRPWFDESGGAHPRRAGVSAFGFGGTNFHVVLEEYDGDYRESDRVVYHPYASEVFLWREASYEALRRRLTGLVALLDEEATGDLAELAHAVWSETASGGVEGAAHRLAIVADSVPDLHAKLKKALGYLEGDKSAVTDPRGVYLSSAPALTEEQVSFVYSGQGSQRLDMLRDLVLRHPWCHTWFTDVNALAAEWLEKPLTRYVYPVPVFDDEERRANEEALDDTRVAQPALAAVEVFATRLLRRFGLRPGLVGGHSFGEYSALWASGVVSGRDLIRLAAFRGHVSAEAVADTPGAMAAIQADEVTTREALSSHGIEAHVANLNSPDQTVIAGTSEWIDRAVATLGDEGLRLRRLAVTAPFHTPLVREAAEALAERLADVDLAKPEIPAYSNVLGETYPEDPAEIRCLLQRQIGEPVRFERQVRRSYADGARLFIEVGPGTAMTKLVGRILGDQPHHRVSLDAGDRDGITQLAHVLGLCAALGRPVDLDEWFRGRPLNARSVEEWGKEHHRHPVPGRLDWIVDATGVRPATQASDGRACAKGGSADTIEFRAVRRSDSASSSTASGDERERSSSSSPEPPSPPSSRKTLSNDRSVTAVEDESSNSRGAPDDHPAPELPSVNGEALRRHQHMMEEWLELQRRQQATFDRALRLQERMLTGRAHLPSEESAAARSPARTSHPESSRELASPSEDPPATRTGTAPPVPVPRASAARRSGGDGRRSESRAGPERSPTPEGPEASVPSRTSEDPVDTSSPSENGTGEAGTGADGVPSTEQFREDLLEAVSERTGYPVDMLDESLAIESGLGIDSIKMVEIFSSLKGYHRYFRLPDQDEEEQLAEFSSLRTLGDIVESYEARSKAWKDHLVAGEGAPGEGSVGAPASNGEGPAEESEAPDRMVLDATPASAPRRSDEKKKSPLTG